MSEQITLSGILTSIVEPSAKDPLVKFMPAYSVRVKEIEEVLNKIIAGDEIAALFWLDYYFAGSKLKKWMQSFLENYRDMLQICRTKNDTWHFRSNFEDGLYAVYCFVKKIPVNQTTKKDAIRYFMWTRAQSKLSYLIMAFGLAFLISYAYKEKMLKLNKQRPRIRVPFECRQCGRCCLKYGNCLKATAEDIEIWDRAGRTDILQWVGANGELWVNESTGEEAVRCPFLRKVPGKKSYICRIYDARPRVCREYPVNQKQALEDGCPGLINHAKKEKKETTEQRENSADCQAVQTDNPGDPAARGDGGGTQAAGTQQAGPQETESQTAA
jgi:Fe-S-cluster containining protein